MPLRVEMWNGNLRHHYARTCSMWADNFESRTDAIMKTIDEKRYRIWRVYLAGCAYAFSADRMALFQVICTRAGKMNPILPWSRRYIYES